MTLSTWNFKKIRCFHFLQFLWPDTWNFPKIRCFILEKISMTPARYMKLHKNPMFQFSLIFMTPGTQNFYFSPIWMSHWSHMMVDGAEFWISFQWLAFLSILSRWQLRGGGHLLYNITYWIIQLILNYQIPSVNLYQTPSLNQYISWVTQMFISNVTGKNLVNGVPSRDDSAHFVSTGLAPIAPCCLNLAL